MLSCQAEHLGGEQQQRQEVGHRHQAVEGVRQLPDRPQLHRGPHHDQHQKDHPVPKHRPLPAAAEIGHGALAVKAPPQHRGDGEEQHRNGDKPAAPAAQHRVKGGGGEGRPVQPRVPHPGGEDHQGGEGAGDKGVGKDLEHPPKALLDRAVGLGRCVGDGGAAQPRLVGEHPPGDPGAQGGLQGVARHAPCRRPNAEGRAENQPKGRAHLAAVHRDHPEGGGDVEDAHQGDKLFGEGPDPLESPQHHQGAEDHHPHPGGPVGDGEGLAQRLGDGVGLGHIPHPEGGADTQQAKDPREPAPAPAQPLFDVVHRPAPVGAVGAGLPVVHRQHHLGVLGHHPEEGRQPHPEDGPRPPQGEGGGDAGDVAHPHGPGQGGGHGGEGGEVLPRPPLLLLKQAAQGDLEHVSQFAQLQKAGAPGEVDPHPHQHRQHHRPPDKPVDRSLRRPEPRHLTVPFPRPRAQEMDMPEGGRICGERAEG